MAGLSVAFILVVVLLFLCNRTWAMEDVIVISSGSGSEYECDSPTETPTRVVFTPTKRAPSPDLDSAESSVESDSDESGDLAPSCKKIKFESSDSENDATTDYFSGDKDFPVFSRVQTGYGCEQLIKLLMTSAVPADRTCIMRPTGVSENATFVIDVDAVRFSDLKSDDMGTWKATGTKSTCFRISKGAIRFTLGSHTGGSLDYILTRRYYIHSAYQLFKRIIVDIRDPSGARNKFALLQYMFEGPEIQVQVKPHGNAKGSTPYFRTSDSTREQMLTVAAKHTPKLAIATMTKQQGGEMNVRSVSCLPRNREQISNIRRSTSSKDQNVLYSVMLECKRVQGSQEAFVRDVKAAPSPQGILFFDWQLQDMVRFLTNNQHFTILTADTTFNLGEFYVTPTSYHHLMLEDVRSRKHPIILGPVLVHQQKDFSSFNYFASTLVSHDRRIRNVLAFGTDGDKAVVEAFAHNFPFALQLRCFVHLRRNVEEKLHSIGIPTKTAATFLADIFGQQVGAVYKEGLVDCGSEEEYDAALHNLEPIWNTREQPYATSSGPRFYGFFCQYQSNVVKYHMRRDVREAAGLGAPPSTFTTNSSESINAVLKRKVDYKESEWPVFNKHIEQLVESQRDEVIRALSGRGQYRLLPQFQYLGVPIQNWMKMRPDQCRKIISNFQEATLPSSKASTTQGQQKETQSIPNPSSRLSVSAEDSGIDVIPLVTLSATWVKADQLLSAENAITAAPGKDKKARMVLSYTSVVPHLVQSRSGGQYICDDSCLHWKSAKICSHTLAVAEVNHELPEFLHWYSRAGITPNITAVGMQGLPRGSGRKGGRPKRQRKRQALPEPLLTVSPSQISPGTFNTCTDSSGPISQSVSIEVAAPIIPSASACNPTPVVGPPPLIPVSGPSTQPLVPNVNPFYCKFLGGNIRVCRGCRGNLRTADGGIPPPPYDMIIARAERCTFRNSSGELITPRRETMCHYHCKVECLRAAEPGFVCSSLHIPQDIYWKLNPVHIQHLQQSFNISPR